MSDYEIKITSKKKLFDLNIKETFAYRDLIRLFVKRNFALVYKQTALGPLWLILNPLFSAMIYTVIFSRVVGVTTDGVAPFLFYLTSTSLWGLFTNTLSGTSSTFLANANVMGKVYFPRLTIPVSQAISSILKFMIQLAMLVVFYIIYAFRGAPVTISWYIVLVPLLIVHVALFGMAIGIIISSLTIKYRDLSILTSFIIQLWMYITPVLYPLNYLSGVLRVFLMINPMTPIIVNFRYCMMGSGEFMLGSWLISICVTIVLALIGIIMFNRTEKNFIDVV